MSDDEFLTVREAAALVGVSQDAVWHWKRRGLVDAEVTVDGRLLIHRDEVLAAEEATRPRGRPGLVWPASGTVDDGLIGYADAAALVAVPEETVRQWKSRHHLDPAGWNGRAPLFRPADVRAAEERARAVPQGRKRLPHAPAD